MIDILVQKVSRIIQEVKDPQFAAELAVDFMVHALEEERREKCRKSAISRWATLKSKGNSCDVHATHEGRIGVASDHENKGVEPRPYARASESGSDPDPDPDSEKRDIAPKFMLSAPEPDGLPVPSKPRRPRKQVSYSSAFQAVWAVYGRREEKEAAFGLWKDMSGRLGGEEALRDRCLDALRWQGPAWAAEAWKYAPYFERYLKKSRFNDEKPPQVAAAGGGYRKL